MPRDFVIELPNVDADGQRFEFITALLFSEKTTQVYTQISGENYRVFLYLKLEFTLLNCVFWFCHIDNKTNLKQDNVRITYH